MPRRRRRHYPGIPGWLTAADIARIRRISRSQAWRVLRALHARYGNKEVYAAKRPDGRGKPAVIWRGRAETVMAHFEALDRTPDERISALDGRLADLEQEVREDLGTRLDQLARDLREFRDRVR